MGNRFLSGSSKTTKKGVMLSDLMINLNISSNAIISSGDQILSATLTIPPSQPNLSYQQITTQMKPLEKSLRPCITT